MTSDPGVIPQVVASTTFVADIYFHLKIELNEDPVHTHPVITSIVQNVLPTIHCLNSTETVVMLFMY